MGKATWREAASYAIAMASAFLSLKAIRADVFANNKASIALLEALAFRRCPRRFHSARTGWEKKLCRYRRDLAQR